MTQKNKYRILGLLCLLHCSCKEQEPYVPLQQKTTILQTSASLLNDSTWLLDSGRLLSPGYHVPAQSYPVPIMFYINEGDVLYDSIMLDN